MLRFLTEQRGGEQRETGQYLHTDRESLPAGYTYICFHITKQFARLLLKKCRTDGMNSES